MTLSKRIFEFASMSITLAPVFPLPGRYSSTNGLGDRLSGLPGYIVSARREASEKLLSLRQYVDYIYILLMC